MIRPNGLRPSSHGDCPGAQSGVPQRVVFVGVAVRPAVDRDRVDVTRRIETAGTERAGELIADTPLERRERCRIEISVPGAMLFARRQTRLAGRARHPHEHRIVGAGRRGMVVADWRRQFHAKPGVIHAGRVDAGDAELLERLPVLERDGRIDERHFHAVVQRFFLRGRQILADEGNHHVPARQDDALRSHGVELLLAPVDDFNFFRGRRRCRHDGRAPRCCQDACESARRRDRAGCSRPSPSRCPRPSCPAGRRE